MQDKNRLCSPGRSLFVFFASKKQGKSAKTDQKMAEKELKNS